MDFHFILVFVVFPAISIGKPLCGKCWLFPLVVAATETWVHERQTIRFNSEGSQRYLGRKVSLGLNKDFGPLTSCQLNSSEQSKSGLEIQEPGA